MDSASQDAVRGEINRGPADRPIEPEAVRWVRYSAFWGLLATAVAFMLIACDTTGIVAGDSRPTPCADCKCYPYGSYPTYTPVPADSATPVGTWIPAPTPTDACPLCTATEAPTYGPPAWPTPIVTCAPRTPGPGPGPGTPGAGTPIPGQPTITPWQPPAWPTLPPHTPLPVVVGNTEPSVATSMEGSSLPGGVALDPRNGHPVMVWSQFNPDAGQQNDTRVYVEVADPTNGQWRPARSVNPPGNYTIGKGPPESAVGVGGDGTIYVVYARSTGSYAWLQLRTSTDSGATWSTPSDLPYGSSNNELYGLRMVIDPAGQPHIAVLVVAAGCSPDQPCGDIVYYERLVSGSWRNERRPVGVGGDRQYSVALTTYPIGGGVVRTILGWNEGGQVYSSYKDGPSAGWSAPVFIIDGNSHPYGIPDYAAGFGGSMHLVAFSYNRQTWVYFFWALYSTGRICYVYSHNGGLSWSQEDALAYEPISPTRAAHIGEPLPFWDAAHNRVFVVYRYAPIARGRDASDPTFPTETPGAGGVQTDPAALIRGGGGAFMVFSQAKPGATGRAWTMYEDPNHEPLRLFAQTQQNQASRLRASEPLYGTDYGVWLLWSEQTGERELYRAVVFPSTLLSGVLP